MAAKARGLPDAGADATLAPGHDHAAAARRRCSPPTTDVLVVGGGPAGIGAALGAAEAGAQRHPRRALRLPRRQRHRGAGHAADVVPHPARRRSERPGATKLLPDRPRPGRAGGGRRAGQAARAAGRAPAARSRPRSRPATWCRSTPSCSSSSRSSCWTRPACSSCSTPSPAASIDDGPVARRGVRDQVRTARDPRPGGGRLHRRRRRRGAAPARPTRSAASRTGWCSR